MVNFAEIINQPFSGEFSERIYDIQNPWNSSNWTWIKFVNEDMTEWCGVFRGSPINVALSPTSKTIIVLTTDFLFLLNIETGDIIDAENKPQYRNLTVSPNGDFVVADSYNIEIISDSLKEKRLLKSPIEMDLINFIDWDENKLLFSCEEFTNWSRQLFMELDMTSAVIQIKDDI